MNDEIKKLPNLRVYTRVIKSPVIKMEIQFRYFPRFPIFLAVKYF